MELAYISHLKCEARKGLRVQVPPRLFGEEEMQNPPVKHHAGSNPARPIFSHKKVTSAKVPLDFLSTPKGYLWKIKRA